MAKPDDKRDDAAEQAEESSPKGFSLRLIIIIVVAMVIVAVAASVVTRLLFAPSHDTEGKEAESEETEQITMGKLFKFDEPIIVNLAESQGQRYLKVQVQLEVSDPAVHDELTVRTPQFLDLLITVFSSKTIDDVSDTKGRNRLRNEVIHRMNAQLKTGTVRNVYFTEFVVQ